MTPDLKTFERLLKTPKKERCELSTAIMSAVVAFLLGQYGPMQSIQFLQEWIDELATYDVTIPPKMLQ